MTQCPGCDAIKMFSAEPQGDGKCSACHGTGYGGFLKADFNPLVEQLPGCDECQGTGRCQACGGLGLIEEYEPSLAA